MVACGLDHSMKVWSLIFFFFFLTCSATKTDFKVITNSEFDVKIGAIMDDPSENGIINFKLVQALKSAVKNVEQHEAETAFGLYLEAANFDELFEDFQGKVHSVIKKRLDDALILK